ncbi:MAG: hypothetical protein WD097_00210 [Balneolales bacterium]
MDDTSADLSFSSYCTRVIRKKLPGMRAQQEMACRELAEEVGISPDRYRVAGTFTPYLFGGLRL